MIFECGCCLQHMIMMIKANYIFVLRFTVIIMTFFSTRYLLSC